MKPKEVLLIGAGGQCKSMLPIIKSQREVAGIVLDNPKAVGAEFQGIPVLYSDADLPKLVDQYDFLIAIGQTPINTSGRRAMYERLKALSATIVSMQSLCAIVHGFFKEGSFIHDMAFVNVDAVIGENTIINTGAIIEHDVQIGKHCHICPGAVVLGGCQVCDGTIIGAGSVVVSHIPEPGFYAGNPVRKIQLGGPTIKIVPAGAVKQ